MFPETENLNEIDGITFRMYVEQKRVTLVIGFFNEYGYGGENNLWLTSDVNVPAGNGLTWISLRNI